MSTDRTGTIQGREGTAFEGATFKTPLDASAKIAAEGGLSAHPDTPHRGTVQSRDLTADESGLSGHTTSVEKTGQEGILLIDSFSGKVLPDDQQPAGIPEWADGYAMANLPEFVGYYQTATGQTLSLASDQLFNADDLSWLAIDPASGLEMTIEASDEHRMERAATLNGLSIEEMTEAWAKGGSIQREGAISMEIASDKLRKEEELQGLYETQNERFEQVAATGTSGE